MTSLEMFFNKSLAGFLFSWVEEIDLGDFWDKGVFKIDGMVEDSMGR